MASIFNKKQEVLDLVLTNKGRELYSKGKLKPAYYKFYDEDIIYEAGNSELQNEIYDRIKDGLYEKPIISEGNTLETGGKKGEDITMLHNELGKYNSLSQAAPAWQILFQETPYSSGSFSKFPNNVTLIDKNGTAQETLPVDNINTYEERIPQLNINVDVKYYEVDDGETATLYEDIKNRDIFLNIKEHNAFLPTERQDLEIEVFKIVSPDNDKNFLYGGTFSNATEAALKKMEFENDNFDENSVETFLNIMFDSTAIQQSNFKVKNIYTGVVDDPDLCEIE
tara:strand:- start:340 stop:1185 length:846 start_codon:yes stop_codon:yes gene_type:complete